MHTTLLPVALFEPRALVAWLATYWIHSTILIAVVALGVHWVRRPGARELLWKGALVGGVLTASLSAWLGSESAVASIALPVSPEALQGGAPIALELEGERSDPAVANLDESVRASIDAESRGDAPLGSVSPPAPERSSGSAASWFSGVAWGWVLVAVLGLVGFAVRRRRSLRPFANRQPVRDAHSRAILRRLLRGRRRGLRLTECDGIASPVALICSEICLPSRATRELRPAELEAMLAHELAHVERRDPAWSLGLHILERVFFFQPLNALARRRWARDVELCCDDAAAERTGEPAELARCLASVAEWLERVPAPSYLPGMAHSPSALVERVARLLNGQADRKRERRATFLVGMIGVLAAVGWAGPAVHSPIPQDEKTKAKLVRIVIDVENEGRKVDAETGVPADGTRPWKYDDTRRLRYSVGTVATNRGGDFEKRLRAYYPKHAGASFAVAPSAKALVAEVTPIVDVLADLGVETILVEGDGDLADALRAYIVQFATTIIEIRVLREGTKLDVTTGNPWKGKGRFKYDDDRLLGYMVADRKVQDLRELQRTLKKRHRAHPKGRIVIDAQAGSVYQDVVDVLDAAILAGFVHIGFSGAYDDASDERHVQWTKEYERDFRTESPEREAESDYRTDREVAAIMTAANASEDDVYVLEVRYDGAMSHDQSQLLDPASDAKAENPYARVQQWLRDVADRMNQAPLFGDRGPITPSDVLEIRADRSTVMTHVQRVMESCGSFDVQVWKIELGERGSPDPARKTWLPRDVEPAEEEVVEEGEEAQGEVFSDFDDPRVEVVIRVLEPGRKIGPDGQAWIGDGPFTFDDTRRVQYSVGPARMTDPETLKRRISEMARFNPDLRLLTIDPRTGTTFGEVLDLIDIVGSVGFEEISLVGAYERSGF